MEKGSSGVVRARERVDQQLLDIGTLSWPLLLTIPDGVCRGSDEERATVSDCGGRDRAWQGGEPRGPTTTTRLLAALARLGSDSTLLSGEKIRDSAQLRHAGPPLVGWLAGWVGLAHREPTGPPTATIHRNRAPSNPSDSHSPVYRLATSTVSAREVGRDKGEKKRQETYLRFLFAFFYFYEMRYYEIIDWRSS